MNALSFLSQSETDTDEFGIMLAESLVPGTTVGLCGTLGAGKTRLVQSVAIALGAQEGAVVSPTFVLIQEYPTHPPVYHIDTYRLHDEDEFLELGVEEYFESDGITFVEWADRMTDCLPDDRLEIHLVVLGENRRRFEISALGEASQTVVDHLAKLLPKT